jgi:hypothetical protein
MNLICLCVLRISFVITDIDDDRLVIKPCCINYGRDVDAKEMCDNERLAGKDMGGSGISNDADGNDDYYSICGWSVGYLSILHQLVVNKICGFGW